MVVDEPPTLETTPVDLPPEIIALLAACAPAFSDRAWAKAQVLAVGAIVATGNRTVCSALRIMGLSQERHFTNYHRLLPRDAWSCLAAGQVLLGRIVAVLPRDWPIGLAADDTIRAARRPHDQGQGLLSRPRPLVAPARRPGLWPEVGRPDDPGPGPLKRAGRADAGIHLG